MDLLNSVIGAPLDEEIQQVLLNWPPFFTIQDHAEIRSKQLKYWAEISFSYLKKAGIWESSLSHLSQNNFTLFQENSLGITKKLNMEEILLILEEMENQGKISWKSEASKNNFYVNKYSCYELADAIYNWAKSKGKVGSIETLKWISEGEDTDNYEKFYGLREELILKSVKVLESDGRAQIFPLEKNKFGVKFK